MRGAKRRPEGAGFVTVPPSGIAVPDASNLNFVNGETAANSVTAAIGIHGKVCLNTNGTTDLIVVLDSAYIHLN